MGTAQEAQVTDLLHEPYQAQQKGGRDPKNKHLWLGLFVKAGFVALSFQPLFSPRTSQQSGQQQWCGAGGAGGCWSPGVLHLVDTSDRCTPSIKARALRGSDHGPVGIGRVGAGHPWSCDVHTRLSLFAGSYYLTTTYGVLEHIKNYDKITVTRQLSVEVQDSIHRWERRRTLNKARASRSSVQVAGIIS